MLETETAFLDGGLCTEPSALGWEDFWREVCVFLGADKEHRAGMVAHLTPDEPKAKEDEGCGRGRRTSWVMSLSVKFVLKFVGRIKSRVPGRALS